MKRLDQLPKRTAEFIEPMDCAPVPHLPDGSNWLFEIKLDGYRAVAVKSDRGVNLFSRRHKSFNHQYPHLVEALGELLKSHDAAPKTAVYATLPIRAEIFLDNCPSGSSVFSHSAGRHSDRSPSYLSDRSVYSCP